MSEFRRIIAWALDMLVIMAPVAVFFAIDKEKFMNAVYDVRYLVVIAVYIVITFTIVTAVTKGRTIGKALVNIKTSEGREQRKEIIRLQITKLRILRLILTGE